MDSFEIDAQAADKHNLKTRFPEECKRLPYTYLEDYEKQLVDKCLNKEKFTDEELTQLKVLLAKYRPHLKNYDTVTIEKNLDENLTIIKTSSELLRLLNDPERFRIDMRYTVGDKPVLLKLKIKQLPDSDYLALLDTQTRVFRDLDMNERRVYAKAATKASMTIEEQNLVQSIQDKINERIIDYESNAQDITEILAKIVDFVDDPELSYEDKLKFWKQIDLPARILLFTKIKEKLNISDKTEEELFPTPR